MDATCEEGNNSTIYRETLKAGVQYNDFVGTSAADRGDRDDLDSDLRAKGLINLKSELVVAIKFYSGENHGGPVSDASITVIIANISGYQTLDEMLRDPDRPRFRGLRLDMTNDEFFGYFKRFEVMLHHPKYDALIGPEFEVEYSEE